MFIKRDIEGTLSRLSRQFRAVTVTGPRQSGKTTLIRQKFASYKYVSLEDPDARLMATNDPRQFLDTYDSRCFIDEVQQVPGILSYLQGILDMSQEKAQYILSGSQNFILSNQISQSLVGRTALLTLLPMSLAEIRRFDPKITLEEAILKGGYPGLYASKATTTEFYASYTNLYLERDVRSLRNVGNLIDFEKFINLVAGRVGQLVNFTNLSSDIGVDAKTIKQWLTVLETSFITFRIGPYSSQLSKRIVKSPKIYFYDTGLLCYLLNITTTSQLTQSPYFGNIFENFVITEKLKKFHNNGQRPQMYFIRDKAGREIDLLAYEDNKWIATEIKSAQTWHPSFVQNLKYYQNLLINDPALRDLSSEVIYRGKPMTHQNIRFKNL